MFGITAGYHRYFAHKAYRTSRAFQLVLALFANTSLMRGPISWAAHHRHHHRESDTERDFHSPRHSGFLFSHTLWFLTRDYTEESTLPCRDLSRFPELRRLDRYYGLPSYALGALCWAVGGAPWFVWGYLLPTVLAWHGTFTINSLSHVLGTRRYDTPDDSKNSFLLALATLGEGWHNNHHHQMNRARQGVRWWEVDASYYVLWVLSLFGLVWDLHTPIEPEQVEPTSG